MMTIKTQSQAPTAERAERPQILGDGELDRVVGGQAAHCQGAHHKTVTLAMRKSAGSD
jgi:hypothetical protein